MTQKHELNQQDAIIEQIISQLDLSGMTQEKLFGQDESWRILNGEIGSKFIGVFGQK